MRQRALLMCVSIVLAFSVFFITPLTALAAEDESSTGDDPGMIVNYEVTGVSQSFNLSPAAISDYDYQGASSIHTLSQYGYIELPWSAQGDGEGYLGANFPVEFNVPTYFRLAVQEGHTYSGQVEFKLSCITDMSKGMYYINSMSFAGFDQQSMYDGITCSYWGPTLDGLGGTGILEAGVWIVITFDNYQPTFTGNLNINMNLRFQANFLESESTAVVMDVFKFNSSVSSDWSGKLLDYPTASVNDSDGSLIQNQTNQQQQIAQQQQQQSSQQHQEQLDQQNQIAQEQASQSAQQHEDMKTGFTDDVFNENVSGAGTQIDSYIKQESELMDSQFKQMSDFASQNFNTGLYNTFLPAVASVSTWYTDLWNSFEDFNIVFVVVLGLGVAALITGIKRR